MFTGLIQETGTVERTDLQEGGLRVRVRAPASAQRLPPGGSVAINGVCLSAESVQGSSFILFCTRETLSRTTLASLRTGDLLNVELPLRVGEALGGHWVQGHVDGTAEILAMREEGGDCWTVVCSLPGELRRYVVEKGSIALDGISLTVAGLEAADGRPAFRVAVIPETWKRTNLRSRRPGDRVHVEVDILAKYVESLLRFAWPGSARPEGITLEFLKDHGFE